MRLILFVVTLTLCLFGAACGLIGADTETGEANPVPARAETDREAEEEAPPASDEKEEKKEFTGEIRFPFDFPEVGTTAKEGEIILAPSFNWITDALQKDPEKVTFIWYNQRMSEPGAVSSKVKYTFENEPKNVPNPYIIPIPRGGKAKRGDILLTWWQSGSGMQRAIVVDDRHPAEPVVRYLDIKYDNPAKSRDQKTTIGKMDQKLKPDSFVVIKNEMEPGTTVLVRDGDRERHGQVIRAAGDKVFVKMFAGRIKVVSTKLTTPVPVKPALKAGDRVKAPFVGSFRLATVEKVDNRIGRVWIKYDSGSSDIKVVSLGDVMPV